MNRQHSFFNKIDHKLSMDKEIQGRLTTTAKVVSLNIQTSKPFSTYIKQNSWIKGNQVVERMENITFQEEMKL